LFISKNSIIVSRQVQRNFQLIIITHDEDFMQLLGKSDYADYYYRIQKSPEGSSTIQKEYINS